MKVNSHLTSERCLARNFFVTCLLVFALAFVSTAQDVTSKISDYMNAQVEVNHFSGSILIAQHGKVLVKQRYGSAVSLSNARN